MWKKRNTNIALSKPTAQQVMSSLPEILEAMAGYLRRSSPSDTITSTTFTESEPTTNITFNMTVNVINADAGGANAGNIDIRIGK